MKFLHNKAAGKGGAVFCEQGASFHIQNCEFSQNKAKIGSAIFMQHSYSSLSSLVSSQISENHSTTSGSITLLESNLEVIDSTIYKNTAKANPSIEVMFGSVIYLNSSQIFDQSGEGSHFSAESQSRVFVFQSNFSLSTRDSFGFAASSIKIFSSQFVSRKSLFADSSFEFGPYFTCAKS